MASKGSHTLKTKTTSLFSLAKHLGRNLKLRVFKTIWIYESAKAKHDEDVSLSTHKSDDEMMTSYSDFAARSSTILFMKCKVAVYNKPRVPRPASWLLTRDVGQSMNAETVLSPPVPRCRPRPRVLLLQITNVIICVGREMVWKDGDGEKLLVTRHSAQTSGHASPNMDNILPVIISTFHILTCIRPYLMIIISSHLCISTEVTLDTNTFGCAESILFPIWI